MSAAVAPRVAVAPATAPEWYADAVRQGGGTVVPVSEAEVLVWADPRDVEGLVTTLAQAPEVAWVQLPWAGVERFAEAGVFDDDRVWTCGKGVYAEPVAEHALALALAGLRRLDVRVPATSWGPPLGTSLFDGRATVLGAGGITEVLVDLLRPMRTQVTVVRRHADRTLPGADVVGMDGLHDALETADAVFLALALTPDTRGIIGRAELASMQPHAWLVNVARGEHVVTDDLVAALREGTIGGAGLDVTDPEPLPDGHPLWALPNCIITPHCANTPEMARPPLTARIAENVRRYVAGEPLIGRVDRTLGY